MKPVWYPLIFPLVCCLSCWGQSAYAQGQPPPQQTQSQDRATDDDQSPLASFLNVLARPFKPKSKPNHDERTPAPPSAEAPQAEEPVLPEKAKPIPEPLPPPKFQNALIWDGFEDPIEWTNEAAQAPATLAISPITTEGDRSLRVAFTNVGKSIIELRREVRLDLTMMDYVLVDVNVDALAPMTLALLFRVGPTLRLYETPAANLAKGWNKDVAFDLRAEVFKTDSIATYDNLFDGRDDVRRVSLLLGIGANKKGAVLLDNIRFVGNPLPGWEKRRPAIDEIIAFVGPTPPARPAPAEPRLKKFQTLTVQVKFQSDYVCAFDPAEVSLTGTFVDPDGKQYVQPGYLDHIGVVNGADEPIWLIKFTPTRPGRWDYFVSVRNPHSEVVSHTLHFTVEEKAEGRGFIRRSARDPRYFEFDDGAFYYPLGQNVCWTTNYELHFKKMAAAGENFARIWICPWHLPLEGPKDVGLYDLEVAAKLDAILALAQKYGIYVQLVLLHHGMINNDFWSQNPYNLANGGPCEFKETFFTNPEARTLFKRRLRYMAARWGASPALFAWELLNEADLCDAYTDDDIIAWHNEMSAALKAADAHKHLVTTSAYGDLLNPKLVALANIDFAQDHIYDLKLLDAVLAAFDTGSALRSKPYFIGELGAGTTPDVDQADKRGSLLHAALWAAFMLPTAGNAMPWWWDTFIEPNNLYYHWRALANFAANEDRRGKSYVPFRVRMPGAPGRTLLVLGIMTRTEAMFWVTDPAIAQTPSLGQYPVIPANLSFWLVGLEHGDFSIEFWDTYTGKLFCGQSRSTQKGRLKVTLPPARKDIACKVKFLGTVESPGLVLRVDEQRAAVKLGAKPDERTKELARPVPASGEKPGQDVTLPKKVSAPIPAPPTGQVKTPKPPEAK